MDEKSHLETVFQAYFQDKFSHSYFLLKSITVIPIEQILEIRIQVDLTIDTPNEVHSLLETYAIEIQSHLLKLFPLDVQWNYWEKRESIELKFNIQDENIPEIVGIISQVQTKKELALLRLTGDQSNYGVGIATELLEPYIRLSTT